MYVPRLYAHVGSKASHPYWFWNMVLDIRPIVVMRLQPIMVSILIIDFVSITILVPTFIFGNLVFRLGANEFERISVLNIYKILIYD